MNPTRGKFPFLSQNKKCSKELFHNFQRNEAFVLFRCIKRRFLANSSPVMLMSRKVSHDNRVVTDFRHLNVRIAKNTLAYPLLKDTF